MQELLNDLIPDVIPEDSNCDSAIAAEPSSIEAPLINYFSTLKNNMNRCLICNLVFTSKLEFNLHMETHQNHWEIAKFGALEESHSSISAVKKDDYICGNQAKETQCLKRIGCFEAGSEFKEHFKIHEIERTLIDTARMIKKVSGDEDINDKIICVICGLQSQFGISMKEHMKSHIEEKFFECPDCANIFEDLFTFREHMETHENIILQLMTASPTIENCDNEIDLNDTEIYFSPDHRSDESDSFANEEKFLCDVCNEEFSNSSNLQLHKESHQGVSKIRENSPLGELSWQTKDKKLRPYTCKQCNRSFTLASSLSLHKRRTHLGIKPYKCTTCDWSFAQSSDLIKHIRKHTGERPYKCDHCGLSFTQKRNLKNHTKMHSGSLVKCEYCNQQFQLGTSLNQHLKKHKGSNVMSCPHCNIPYTTEKYLNSHIRRTHKEIISDKICCTCNEKFSSHTELIKHKRKHAGENPYLCKECGKTFSHQTSLSNHYVVHSGQKPHQCTYCGQAFSFAGNLKVHIRTHTGERPYQCNICKKRFFRSGNLREHIKVHTKEKSVKCEFCDKYFATCSSYSKHKKIHTGERPHKCHICDKSFIQMAHLTKHIRVHTGEKPYPCSVCGKCFKRDDTLKGHMKIHQKTTREMEQSHTNKLKHDGNIKIEINISENEKSEWKVSFVPV